MKIERCHIGQDVVIGKDGIEGKIIGIWPDQVRVAVVGGIQYASPDSIDPASDPCQGCQKIEAARLKAFWEGKAEGEKAADRKLGSMNESLEYWQTACMSSRRDATYWREELEKMQNEALAESRKQPINCAGDYDTKPVSEVAKIRIQISPAVMDMILKERD